MQISCFALDPLVDPPVRQSWADDIAFDLGSAGKFKPRFLGNWRRRNKLGNDLAALRDHDGFMFLPHLIHQLEAFGFEFCGRYFHAD